mmetsp:Transcript_30619/g.60069  ORF Transcript_30619/g.60069 Transcript_30619/m.60069 type:complete len:339 (+) Transcript_30619:1-1017(+)
MATGQAAGTSGGILEQLGDERKLLFKEAKSGKSPGNGATMNSKAAASGATGDSQDPWLSWDPWSAKAKGDEISSGSGPPPKEARSDEISSGSARPPPTEAKADNRSGSTSTTPSPTQEFTLSPEGFVEKLAQFLLAKPNQLSQRKEVLLASCEQGHKLVGNVTLTAPIVEEAFKLARRRLAQSQSPAVESPAVPEEKKEWAWEESSAGKWWHHDDRDRWNQSDWWDRNGDWKEDNAAWQPDNDPAAAAATPVPDDEPEESDGLKHLDPMENPWKETLEDAKEEELPDEQLVERLVLYLRQKDDMHKGMAVLRSCASGVPRPAAEAAIARVFAETQDFQ